MNKLNLFLICIFCHYNSYGQKFSIDDKKERLKFTILENSLWYIPTIKASYEFQVKNNKFLEPELGYSFYSFEDKIKVKGIYVGASINRYKFEEGRYPKFIKFNPYYHKIYLQNYLEYDTFLPNFGNYSDYRMTRFSKNRFGFNFHIGKQYPFSSHSFLEISTGLGLEYYNTITPKEVTQLHFRNGDDNNKQGIRAILLLGIKLGWAL